MFRRLILTQAGLHKLAEHLQKGLTCESVEASLTKTASILDQTSDIAKVYGVAINKDLHELRDFRNQLLHEDDHDPFPSRALHYNH